MIKLILLNKPKLLVLLLVLVSNLLIAQKTFTRSGGNNNWEDPDNWSPIGVPTATDDVVISGFSVFVNDAAVASKVTLNATISSTALYVESNSLIIDELEVNQNTANSVNMDVFVRNSSSLIVNGDVNFTRSILHTFNRRMRISISSTATTNITGDFTINSNGGGNESQGEILLEDDAVLTVTGDLNLNSNSTDSDLRINLNDNSKLSILDSLKATYTGAIYNDNSDLFFLLEEDANISVGKSVHIKKDGGDDILFRVLGTSSILVNENFTLDQSSGRTFEFNSNGTTTDITILGELTLNYNGEGVSGLAENFDLDLNSGSANFGPTTINVNSSTTDIFDLIIRPTGSDLTFEELEVNFHTGDDFLFYINSDNVTEASSLTINGDFTVNKDGGDNLDWNFFPNATTTIAGDISINIETDDLDDFDWDIRDHDITCNDLLYSSSGASAEATSGDFDIFLNGSTFLIDDFIVEHNAMNDFRIFLDNNGTFSGSRLNITDSLRIVKGNLSSNISLFNSINNANSIISVGVLDLEISAGIGQQVTIRNSGEDDAIEIANDFNIRATGVDNGANDIRLASEDGEISIGGDFNILTTDMADISINLSETEFTVGGDLTIVESNGGRTSNIIINAGNSLIMGDLLMEGSFTGNQNLIIRENGKLTVNEDLNVNVLGGEDYNLTLGNNNFSRGVLEIGGNANFTKLEDSDDINCTLFEGAKFLVNKDFIINSEASGNDRIFFFLDDDQDTLSIGQDFTITTTTGGTINSEDDIFLDKNSGVFEVGRNLTLSQNGGDDILVSMNTTVGGYSTIGGDVFLDIDDADDLQYLMGGDSNHVYGSFTVEADNSGFVEVGILEGIVDIDGEVLIQNNISTSNTDWDQDAGIVTLGKGMHFITDAGLETRVFLDSNSVLNITDSLIFDLGSTAGASRVRLNSGSGSGSIINVAEIQINQNGGALAELFLFNDALLNVSNNIDVNFSQASGDYFEIITRDADTILIGNDLLVDFVGTGDVTSDFIIDNLGAESYIQVGRDIVANMNLAGEVILDLEDSKTDIGRYFTINADNARGTDWNIDDAVLNIVDDFVIDVQNYNSGGVSDNIMNVNGTSDLNFNQDFILSYNSSMVRTISLLINAQSSVYVADSLFYDLDLISGSTQLLINNNLGSGAELLVGGSLIYDHEKDAGDVLIRTNGEDSKIEIEKDFITSFDADGGDFVELELNGLNDTLIVKGDLIWDMPSGSGNGNDDFIIDINDVLLFDIGGNVSLTGQDIGGINFFNDGGDVNINGFLDMIDTSGVEKFLQLLSGTIDVGEDVRILGHESSNFAEIEIREGVATFSKDVLLTVSDNTNASARLDIDLGIMHVFNDLVITSDNGRDADISVQGGELNVGDDVNLICPSCENTDLTIGLGGQMSVADSLYFDIDESTFNTLLYFNNISDKSLPVKLSVGNNLIIDHEGAAKDVLFRQFGNSTVEIGNDIIANFNTIEDELSFRLDAVTDSLFVGGEVNLVAPTGSYSETGVYDTDDDITLDVDRGYVDIKEGLTISMFGASNPRLLIDSADVNIGGELLLTADNAGGANFQIFDGSLDVVGDKKILITNGVSNFGSEWSFFGGVSNFMEDVIIQIEGEISNMRGSIDGDAVVNIADSLIFDNDEMTGDFFVTFDNPVGNGPSLDVGSTLYIDHEKEGDDMYINLNGNAKLNVKDNIIANFDADKGDDLNIRLFNDNDSLLVGGHVILTMESGTYTESGTVNLLDDISFRVLDGVSSIAGDLIIDITGGSRARYDQNNGTSLIGGNLLLLTDEASGFSYEQSAGDLIVEGDFNSKSIDSRGGQNLTWGIFNGTATIAEDVEIQVEGNIASVQASIDGNAVFTVADTMLINLDSMVNDFNLFFDKATGNGPELNVGSYFIVDHEKEAEDVYIYLRGNSTLNVGDDIIASNDAENNDILAIELQNADDTLLVGDDVIFEMHTGLSSAEGNDINFNVEDGFVDIKDSLIFNATAGADIEFSMNDGEINVGSSISVIGSDQDDIIIRFIDGVLNVDNDIIIDSREHDDLLFNFDVAELNISRDVVINNHSGDLFTLDMDGVDWNVAEDMTIIQGGTGVFQFNMDNNTTLNVGDSLVFNSVNASISRIYLEDGNSTGSSITVGNDLIFDDESTTGDVLVRLEGDSKIDVGDDLVVTHNQDGTGDYFRIDLEEVGGNDTLLVGGDLLILGIGSGGTDQQDYIEIELSGGYVGIQGEANMVADNLGSSDLIFDINDGHLEIGETLTMMGTNSCDDVMFDVDGGQVDITGDVLIVNYDGDQAEFSHQGIDGTYKGTVDVFTNNSVFSGAYMIIGGTGNVIFEDTVTVAAVDGGRVEIESNGTGNITFLENVYLLDTNSVDQALDFNGSSIELQKDLIVYNEGGDEFDLDIDGGDFIIGDDFILTTLNTTNSVDYRLDRVSSLTVKDSMIVNVTNNGNNFIRLYLDESNNDGTELSVGTLQMNRGDNVGDTRVLLRGESKFTIANDMDINHTNVAGGDYFEIELSGINDTLLIGGDLLIDHIGDNNINGNVVIDVLNGYMNVKNDMIVNLDGSGSITFDTRNDAQFIVSDSLVLNMVSGNDIDVDFDANSIIQFGSFDINKEAASDEVRMVISDDVLWTIDNTFNWNHTGDERDLGRLQFNNGSPIMNVGEMIVNTEISNTSTNGGNNFFIDLNAGTLNVSDDLLINFNEGLDFFFTLDGASTAIVGGDLHANKDSGRDIYIDLGSSSGNNLLRVEGNLNMDALDNPDENDNIELEINNTSIVDINGDLQFNTTKDEQLEVDINGSSDMQIAGAIDRAINGNEYGEILCDATAMVTYDGTSAQIMEEEAGGGSDLISYGIVRINNTSGLLPAVTLENNLGGSASVTGMNYQEGQLYLNKQTLTVTNGASTAVIRTNGSVRSEDTDNSSIVKWQMGTSTGDHLFPFSTASGEYLPLNMDLTSGNAGDVDIATYPTSSDNLPFSPGVTNMNSNGVTDNTLNVADRHWQIDVSGTPTINMTIPYLESEIAAPNTIPEGQLQAQRWDGAEWEFPVGTVNTGDNTVTVSGVTTFSPWVLSNGSSPLPITLLGVVLEEQDGITSVYWATAQEVDNDYFEVLMSEDGINFETVGRVEGAGQSSKPNDYSYIIGELSSGTYYVKIRQTDFDGTYTDSKIESILIGDDKSGLTLYPNLITTGESATLLYSAANSDAMTINIYDEHGYVHKVIEQSVTEGSGKLKIDTEGLVIGTYLVKVVLSENTKIFKLIVN